MSYQSRSARRVALLAAGLMALLGAAAVPAGAVTVSLPDGRVLELVTPTASPGVKVDVLPLARVGSDGNEIAFQTWGNRDVGASNTLETYLSTRTPGGWSVKLLSPPEAAHPNFNPAYDIPPNPFFAFNDNLSEGVFDSLPASPIVPGEPANSDNLYLKDTGSGSSTLITTQPSNVPYVGPRVAATSPDLRHVLFDNGDGGQGGNYFNVPGFEPGDSQEVYAWSPDQGMSIASVLPDGRVAGQGGGGASYYDNFGATAGAGGLDPVVAGDPQTFTFFYGGNPHAISDDGSRIFFSNPPPAYVVAVGHIFQRRDQGQPDASTVQLDTPAPGTPLNEDATYGDYASNFITATPDGHQALFSSCEPLTPDSTAVISPGTACQTENGNAATAGSSNSRFTSKNDLYVYDEDGNGGAGSLTDITTGDPNGADVLGVLGTSTDLSRVYFAARGNLTGTAPASSDYCNSGMSPQRFPNLYVWDKTDGTRFLGQLSIPTDACFQDPLGDIDTWQDEIDGLHAGARVTADGRYLAFTSDSTTLDPSYNTIDPDSELPHKEVYLYDYNNPGTGPTCVSCVGTGPPSTDSTINSQELTTQSNDLVNYPDWEKQNLLPNGTLYFESGEKLVPADHNTTTDVYEYKPGTGTLSLMSSGQSTEPSNFVGATADGSNVYFTTDQSLLPSDIDNNIDIYDARVGGGVANTLPPSGCQSSCSPPPATSTFVGPGNQTPTVVVPRPGPVAFALARLTSAQVRSLAKTGAVTLTITAPGAGRVSAKALAKLGKGAAKTIASASTTARKAGALRLTLRLSAKARASLKKAGHLAVTIQASFGRTTKTLHITLKRP